MKSDGQHSFGCWASKRRQDDLGRLMGWGVTSHSHVLRLGTAGGAQNMGTCVVRFAVPGRDAGLTGRLVRELGETG